MSQQRQSWERMLDTTRIGDYEVLNRLSKGGSGSGFKARQVSTGELVALKLLPPRSGGGAEFRRRFLREARAALGLRHPHVPRGIEAGRAGGFCYFTTEWIEGATVGERIRTAGPFAEPRALEIVGAAALALEHAFAHGLLHGHITPENLLIGRDGVVRLTGLGAPRAPGDLETARYAAPEQARGQTELDTRTDIYALGAALYHMLTGHVPFDGPTEAAILAQHIAEPVPTPAEENPELSRPVCELVGRMMAKEREARPQTPRALVDAIHEVLKGEEAPLPAIAPPPEPVAATAEEPAPAPGRVGVRLSVALALAALALASLGLFLALRRPWSAERPSGAAAAKAAYDAALTAWEQTPADLDAAIERFRSARTTYGGTEAAGLALAKVQQLERQRLEAAKAAYDAALQSWRDAPEELDEAIAGFDAVRSQYPGTEWADQAAVKIGELERMKAELAAQAKAERELAQAVAELRVQCQPLLERGLFGRALKQVEVFREAKPSPQRLAEASKLIDEIMQAANRRYGELVQAANVAIENKDYAKARSFIQTALSFDVRSISGVARKELARIDSREEHAELWAKWDAVKAQADALAAAGNYEEAIRQLRSASSLPLEGVAQLIDEAGEAIEEGRRAAVRAARTAYAGESDKVWALLKERKYPEAEKLLAELGPKYGLAGEWVAADVGALKRIQEFWAAVERGLAARKGKFLVVAGVGGEIVAVEDGAVVVKGPKGVAKGQIHALGAGQAVAFADLKDDERSNLLRGVFLLAEGADLDDAEAALAAAGDLPGSAVYRDRLLASRGWVKLFDGETLNGWRVVTQGGFARAGRVAVEQGRVRLEAGNALTGIAWTGDPPTADYELSLEARREAGGDCFCDLVVPVGSSYCDLALGAWGGTVIGLSNVNNRCADRNVTTRRKTFSMGQWYRLRVRVSQAKVEAWVDEEKVIDLSTSGATLTPRTEFAPVKGLGLATFRTTGAVRNILLRRLPPQPADAPAEAVAEPKPGKWHDFLDESNLRGWRATSAQPDRVSGSRPAVRIGRSRVTIDALTPLQPDRGGRFEQLLDTTTGIAWTRDFPTSDYEISVEVMCASTEGNFCGVLFPVQSARWSLTLGFWGGRGQALLRALSGFAGPHQMRSVQVNLVPGRWHRVRLRVTERELEVWVNDKSLDELPAVRGASLAPYQTGDKEPFGLGAASGKTVLRKILVRRLDEGPEPGKKEKQPPGGP